MSILMWTVLGLLNFSAGMTTDYYILEILHYMAAGFAVGMAVMEPLISKWKGIAEMLIKAIGAGEGPAGLSGSLPFTIIEQKDGKDKEDKKLKGFSRDDKD